MADVYDVVIVGGGGAAGLAARSCWVDAVAAFFCVMSGNPDTRRRVLCIASLVTKARRQLGC